MRDPILLRNVQFRHPPAVRQREQRVVAEAEVAALVHCNRTFHEALAQPHIGRVGKSEGDHAAESCRTLPGWDVNHRLQQLGAIGGVIRCLPSISSAVQAGRAIQRVNLQARVIGQRRQS